MNEGSEKKKSSHYDVMIFIDIYVYVYHITNVLLISTPKFEAEIDQLRLRKIRQRSG